MRNRRKAGVDKDGNLTNRGERRARFAKTRVGRMIGADKRQARYYAAAKKDVDTREEANAALTNALAKGGIAAMAAASTGREDEDSPEKRYYADAFNRAASKGDIGGMNSVLSAAAASGYLKDKDIAEIVRSSVGNMNFKDNETRANWMRNTATKYGGGFLAKDFELKDWMRNGGNRALGNYGEYARSHIKNGMIDAGDVSKMSGRSLAGMASAGLISSGMAREALSSGAGLTEDKKIMLNAIANGATVGNVDDFKKEAENALKNSSFVNSETGGERSMTVGGVEVTRAMRDSWLGPKPTEVRVVEGVAGGGAAAGGGGGAAAGGGGGAPRVPTAQTGIAQEGQAFDVRAMSDETLLDMATNPNASNDNGVRSAAEREFLRRNPDFNNGGTPGTGNNTNQN